MKIVIGLTSLEYLDLLIKLKLVDSVECREIFEDKTGLKYIASRRFKGTNILIFKVSDNKRYSYARLKYEF